MTQRECVAMQPLRCLCGSSSCRGFVGGTQENIISRCCTFVCLLLLWAALSLHA